MSGPIHILLIGVPRKLLEPLVQAGFLPSATEVRSREETARALAERSWDLVLCAYALYGLDAPSAIALVRNSDPDLPVIVVTEPIGEDLAADLMRAGASDIVVTSRLSRLPASVDREMRTARRRRQLRRVLLEEHSEGVEARDPATPTSPGDPESFRALAENSPDLIARFGPDLRRLYVNPAIERLTGLPAGKLIGTRLSEVNFDERYAGPIDKALLEAFALGAEGTLEVRLPGPGDERVYHLRIVPEHGPGGTVETVLVVSRDISALHRSEERMRDFIESALDAILTLDVNGRILEVNPALERMIGETAERVVGRAMVELVDPEAAAELAESLRVVTASKTAHISTALRDSAGNRIEIEATASRQSRRGSETLFVIARDVTERRRVEKELAEESRMAAVGRITTHVSHEFNNILMGIQPFADALKRMSTEPKILEMAEHIARSVRRGRRASENLRAFTQPSPPSLATIDLPAWLAESVRELELMLPAGVRLEVETSELPPSLRGDARQLMQVLTNIVLNARDALGSAGGSIRLAAAAAPDPESPSPSPRLLHLSVSDDGPGIPTEDLGYVLEPFFSTRLQPGLGLTTARQITEAHGGRITIESALGRGTTVHVFIPLAAE